MGLILPASHAIHDMQPAAHCTLCGCPFFKHEMGPSGNYEKHVLGAHDEQELLAHSPAHNAPGLYGKAGDQDWAAWIEKHRQIDPEGRDWARWGRTDAGKNTSGLGDG